MKKYVLPFFIVFVVFLIGCTPVDPIPQFMDETHENGEATEQAQVEAPSEDDGVNQEAVQIIETNEQVEIIEGGWVDVVPDEAAEESVEETSVEVEEEQLSPEVAAILEDSEEETDEFSEITILGKDGFDPALVTVQKGDSVTFYNPHSFGNVLIFVKKGRPGSFSSPTIWQDKRWDYTFDEDGEYEYWTSAFLKRGKIIVE